MFFEFSISWVHLKILFHFSHNNFLKVISFLDRHIKLCRIHSGFTIHEEIFRSQYVESFVEVSDQESRLEILKPCLTFRLLCDILGQSVAPYLVLLDFLNPFYFGCIDFIIGDGEKEGLLVGEELNLFR